MADGGAQEVAGAAHRADQVAAAGSAGLETAPEPARQLRKRLIAFYRQQEQVAYELAGIMAYFPRILAAEQDVRPAAARMRKGLAAAHSAKAQAAVLGAYAGTVAAALDRVQAIRPPALLAKAQLAEAARLGRTTRAVRAVAMRRARLRSSSAM